MAHLLHADGELGSYGRLIVLKPLCLTSSAALKVQLLPPSPLAHAKKAKPTVGIFWTVAILVLTTSQLY